MIDLEAGSTTVKVSVTLSADDVERAQVLVGLDGDPMLIIDGLLLVQAATGCDLAELLDRLRRRVTEP